MSKERDWTGFRWKNNKGEFEVVSNADGGWIYSHSKNGRYVGGGFIGEANLQIIEMRGQAVEPTIIIEPSPRDGESNKELNALLAALQDIAQSIPSDAWLPGTPRLIDQMAHLITKYKEQAEQIKKLEQTRVSLIDQVVSDAELGTSAEAVILTLINRTKELETALKFYAEEKHYSLPLDIAWKVEVEKDRGQRAREALNANG